MVSDDEKAACTWNVPCRLLFGVRQRQMKVQAAFKAWVWRRNAMNAVGLRFRCSKKAACTFACESPINAAEVLLFPVKGRRVHVCRSCVAGVE